MNQPTMTRGPSDGEDGPRPLEGFAWLADRLAAMGPAEIAFRFGEHFKRTVSRFYQPNFKQMTTGPLDPCHAWRACRMA
jgi:hypothetical protein